MKEVGLHLQRHIKLLFPLDATLIPGYLIWVLGFQVPKAVDSDEPCFMNWVAL